MEKLLRQRSHIWYIWFALTALLVMSGCTQTAQLQSGSSSYNASNGTTPNTSAFPDIPIPEGANMIVDRTLIVGTQNWFGQLALNANQDTIAIFDFYRNRLPQFGWDEITSVRAPTSVLTYEREDRILQMQISTTTLRGSEVLITVSPRGKPAPSGSNAPVIRSN